MAGTCEIRFTRYYDARPHEVWAGLTEPDSLARWLAPAGDVELSPGGRFELRRSEGEPVKAQVRALERERLLELDWLDPAVGPSIVRFELTEEGDRTVLVLEHRRVEAQLGMRYLATWERHLDRLESLIDGRVPAR